MIAPIFVRHACSKDMPSKDQNFHVGQEIATTSVKAATRREEPPSPPSSDISMDSSSSIDVVMHSPEKAAPASLPLAILSLKVPFNLKAVIVLVFPYMCCCSA